MNLKLLGAVILAGVGFSAHAGTEMKDPKEISVTPPPPASDAGFYIAVYGGAQFSTDYGNSEFSIENVFGNFTINSKLHSDGGAVGGAKGGYNFASFPVCDALKLRLQPAVEVEGLYIGNESHADGLPGGTTEHLKTNSGDALVNGILRFKNASIVTPYIGVGVGVQYINAENELSVPAGAFDSPGGVMTGLDTSHLDLAVQGLFGIDFKVCSHVSVFTEYKFIDAFDTAGKSDNIPSFFGGGTYHFMPSQIQQNLITAGVKYEF